MRTNAKVRDQYKDDVKKYIDLIRAVHGNISYAEIARRLNQSPQNFHLKIAKGTLDATELFQIAELFGASVRFVRDGKIMI